MGVSSREARISVLPFYLPFINRMSIKCLVTLGSIKSVLKILVLAQYRQRL